MLINLNVLDTISNRQYHHYVDVTCKVPDISKSCIHLLLFSPSHPLFHYSTVISDEINFGSRRVSIPDFTCTFQKLLQDAQASDCKIESTFLRLPDGSAKLSVLEQVQPNSKTLDILSINFTATDPLRLHEHLSYLYNGNLVFLPFICTVHAYRN